MRTLLFIVVFVCLSVVNAWALAVQITNISDFNLGNWGLGDPAPSAHIDICVYTVLNNPAGGYAITVSSPSGFVLQNGSNQIPYSLSWDDSGAGSLGSITGAPLSNGTKLTAQLNANILSIACALGVTGPTARLNLKINQSDMTAAIAGIYNGTITLLLTPS